MLPRYDFAPANPEQRPRAVIILSLMSLDPPLSCTAVYARSSLRDDGYYRIVLSTPLILLAMRSSGGHNFNLFQRMPS
ncbi:hypothetical protein AFLA_005297 [Aspergillus flavus NRRL3357]|nr:hypothetical protein AFLA_005297 [Aspergillus flavus NRRL3357]